MIGFDLQEVEKIKDEQKLLDKIALETEKNYIQKHKCDFKMRVASLWSVKEAVFKALEVSAGEISYKEIELCHKESGQPYIQLYGKAKAQLQKLGGKNVEISLSHQQSVVGAVCIIK